MRCRRFVQFLLLRIPATRRPLDRLNALSNVDRSDEKLVMTLDNVANDIPARLLVPFVFC